MKDIRYYGLLKTIGTTGRQIKRIIRRQALKLSLIGIPVGLLAGFFVGKGLVPVIMKSLGDVVRIQYGAAQIHDLHQERPSLPW
ncbi:MAG: hypothetical protein ACLTLQ_06250 [[Clostridium] scindens]